MSSRRSGSIVVGLAVASLAVTSMGAMVASSELLVDAVDRPARRRLDPLVLDLGSVGTIQAELPRDGQPARPPARRPPAADPPAPPRPQPSAAPPTAERTDGDGGSLVVVVAHTQVVRKIVIRKPVFLPPPRPPEPRPRAHWPGRRWVAHHHRHDRHHHHHRRHPCGERRWRWKHEDPPSRALSGRRARGCPPARARHRTRCPRDRA